MSRLIPNSAFLDLALTISPDDLLAEGTLLNVPQHLKCEWPYGWAWFALLLTEIRERPSHQSHPALASFHETLMTDLSIWVMDQAITDQQRAAAGDHSSYLFALFLLVLASPKDSKLIQRVSSAISGNIAALEDQPDNRMSEHDFFYLPAVGRSIARLLFPEMSLPNYSEPLDMDLGGGDNVHQVGLKITMAWPYAIMAAQGDQVAASRYQKWLDETMKQKSAWYGPFEGTGHWIPQFIWMAIWLRLGGNRSCCFGTR